MTATRKDLSGLELALNKLELDNHQPVVAGLWRLISQAKAAPAEDGQGEAVEVVAYLLKHDSGARLVDVNSQSMQVAQQLLGGHIHKLLTLEQHNHIMAAAKTKTDAELVELLRDVQICRNLTSYPLKLEFAKTRNLDGVEGVHDWMAEVHSRIDAKLKEYE